MNLMSRSFWRDWWRGLKDSLVSCRQAIFLWFSVLFFLLEIGFWEIKVIFVSSPSIPYQICLQIIRLEPRKNDLSIFNFKGKSLVKYVVGVKGDQINVRNGSVWINNKKIGDIQNLSYLHPIESGVIPEGYVFVAGTHSKSLDSRYREIGLIPVSALRGRVIGLIKW